MMIAPAFMRGNSGNFSGGAGSGSGGGNQDVNAAANKFYFNYGVLPQNQIYSSFYDAQM
jgi:hypothetical protein